MSAHLTEPLSALLVQRLTRRRVLASAAEAAVLTLAWPGGLRAQPGPALGFAAIEPGTDDRIRLPPEYRAEVVLRWGDPLLSGVPALDPSRVAAGALLAPGAAAQQARQFGYNCDGIGALERGGRTILCVNHEFPSVALMFPGFREAARAGAAGTFVAAHPECVRYMQMAVGVTVVELAADPAWHALLDAPLNRRIHALTPIELSGPAAGHILFRGPGDPEGRRVLGTFANCAAGTTPWGTYLTAEENVDDYFGNASAAELGAELATCYRRFRPRGRESLYRWEFVDQRFDVAHTPAESLKFGWIVEIDPENPAEPIRKRTALGRLKHEGATLAVARDGRAVVYTGDDEPFEYLYKFVTARPIAAEKLANRDLLDHGTLHVARLHADGRGEWVPLVYATESVLGRVNGFGSQADIVLRCREAADLCAATPLDRCEDVAISPLSGKVYVACTQNVERGAAEVRASNREVPHGPDAANPRAPNRWGHIIEIAEDQDDPAARTFRWEIFLLAGDPEGGQLLTRLTELTDGPLPPDAAYFAGQADAADLSAFAGPDNLSFDVHGRLWIVTDAAQPRGNNNGCFVCPTEGAERGAVRQFLCGPVGAEISGCEFAQGGRTLFLSVQHPGEGGTATEPASHWPDGMLSAPRPSVLAIVHADAEREIGS
jgi:secreted PhoX family phosphatase